MPVPFYLRKPEEVSPKFTLTTRSNGANNNYNKTPLISYNEDNRIKLAENFRRNMEHIANAQPAPSRQRPSSWKDNINYDEGYDSNIEDKFRADHDYLGLADYLSHFRMGNRSEQKEYENEITQLRRYGREYNAIHERATKEQSYSIAFMEAFNNGDIDSLDSDNPDKHHYLGVIDSLGRKQYTNTPIIPSSIARAPNKIEYDTEQTPSTISVAFNDKHVSYALWGIGDTIPGFNLITDVLSKDKDENQFNKFAHETGYDLNEIKALLGDNAISFKEGRTVVNIPKNNIDGIKLLTAIRKWQIDSGRNHDDIQYSSYGTDRNLVSDFSDDIGSQIDRVSMLIDRSTRNKDIAVQNTVGLNQQFSTTVLPYMNERQMQLNKARQAGMISDDAFTSQLKADNAIYENQLMLTAFSKLKIYTDADNEPGNEDLHEMTDNLERGKLKDYIRNAIREDRVSWSAALSNGEYGAYITIAADDNKGAFVTDKEDSRRGMTIFIPGLFTKSIQTAFNSSTQGKTVAEFNSMQQYGYQRELKNGDIIKNVGNNNAQYYDKNTDTWKLISREEAQNKLHQDIIIEDAVRTIGDRAFNNKGERRVGYTPENDAKKIAIAAANELYPGYPIEEYDVAAWNPSKEDAKVRMQNSNADKDEKADKALEIYQTIIGDIYKILNVNIK